MGYLNKDFSNSSLNGNFDGLEVGNGREGDISFRDMDVYNSIDRDSLPKELYQAVIAEPMSMRSATWDKTIDQWWNDELGDGGELVDHGLYTSFDQSWQEQDGIDRAVTVVDTVSGVATWASLGLIAGGILGIPFTFGSSTGAIGAGLVGLGVSFGGKQLASNAIKSVTGIAYKANKAKHFINSSEELIPNLTKMSDKADVKEYLMKNFDNDTYKDLINLDNMEELSDIISKEKSSERIKGALEHTILNGFDTATKPMMSEIRAKNAIHEAIEAENIMLKQTSKKVFKGTPIEAVEKGMNSINDSFLKKNGKINKKSERYIQLVDKLNDANPDKYKLGKIGNKKWDEELVRRHAEETGMIDAEYNLVVGETADLVESISKLDSKKEILKLIKKTNFLTKRQKGSFLEIFKHDKKYKMDFAKKEFVLAAREFTRDTRAYRAKRFSSAMDKVFKQRDAYHGKMALTKTKLVKSLWQGSFDKLVKSIDIDKKKLAEYTEEQLGKLKEKRKKEITKGVKKEFSKKFKAVARGLSKNSSILKAINKMEVLEDAFNIKNMLENQIMKEMEGLMFKKTSHILSSKRKEYKTLVKSSGPLEKSLSWLKEKSTTLGIDTNNELRELKSLRRQYQKIDDEGLKNMSQLELENKINNLVRIIDKVKVKILDRSLNTELNRNLVEGTAKIKSKLIENGDYTHIKEIFDGTGIVNQFKKMMHTLGTNGNHYDILDDVALENSTLKQIFHTPQLQAKKAVDSAIYDFRSKSDEIHKEFNLGEEEDIKLTIFGMLKRQGTASEVAEHRKWLVGDDTGWKWVNDLNKVYKIDFDRHMKKADLKWEDNLAKQKVDNPKKYDKFMAKDPDEIALLKKLEMRSSVLSHLQKRLDYEIHTPKTLKAKGMKKWFDMSYKMVRLARKEELEVLRTFDPKKKIPKSVDGYLSPIPLTRIKGTEKFNKVNDSSILEAHESTGTSTLTKVVPRNLFKMTSKINPDFTLHSNPALAVEKGLRKSLSYSKFRPVEFEIKKILSNSEEFLGETFGKYVKQEVFANYNEGLIRQKGEVDVFLDLLSRNAVYGILGFKASTPLAQLTAIPEFIATFENPLDGIKAFTEGNRMLSKNHDKVDNFFKQLDGEYVERTDSVFSSSSSSAKTVIGSGEINIGINKYASKASRSYELFKVASMSGIKYVDSNMYQGSFVGAYMHALTRNGIDIKKTDIFDLTNKDLIPYVEEASQRIAEGMGSFSIVNKSMFLKTGQLGDYFTDGSMQSWVRAFTLLQSFVYNSMYRMYNNGMVKPSKLWAAGKKGEAVNRAVTSIMSEMVGKMMYIENLERIRRVQESLTGGEYDEETLDRNIMEELLHEYIGHLPVIGSISSTFRYGDTGGIPSHIDGVLGAAETVFDNTFGKESWLDMDSGDWKKMAKAGFIATGVPLNEAMNWAYKYADNHTPEYEGKKLNEYIAKQKVAEDNKNLVKWYIDKPDKTVIRNGRELSVDDVFRAIKELEPRRFNKLKLEINIKTKYEDDSDEILKVLKYTNINIAKFVVQMDQEDRKKWISILNNLGKMTKDLRRKINKLDRKE